MFYHFSVIYHDCKLYSVDHTIVHATSNYQKSSSAALCDIGCLHSINKELDLLFLYLTCIWGPTRFCDVIAFAMSSMRSHVSAVLVKTLRADGKPLNSTCHSAYSIIRDWISEWTQVARGASLTTGRCMKLWMVQAPTRLWLLAAYKPLWWYLLEGVVHGDVVRRCWCIYVHVQHNVSTSQRRLCWKNSKEGKSF